MTTPHDASTLKTYVRSETDYSQTHMSDVNRGVQYVDRRPQQLNAIISSNEKLYAHMLDLAWMHNHATLSYGLVRDFIAACEDAAGCNLEMDRGGLVSKTANAIRAIADQV